MSSPKVKNETIDGIDKKSVGNLKLDGIAKPTRETERCTITRSSRLPTHARSPSTSGQKSKIPTNINNASRTIAMTQNHIQETPRLLTSVASEEAAGNNASPINTGRRLTSRSLTTASSPSSIPQNPSKTKSSYLSSGNSSMLKRQLENQFATKKKHYAMLKKELTNKQKSAIDLYEEMSQLREKLIASGVKDPGKIETINLSVIPAPNIGQQFAINSQALRGSGEQVYAPNADITNEFVSSLESKLRDISNNFYENYKEIFQKSIEIKKFLEKFNNENERKIEPEIFTEFENYFKEISKFETNFEEKKKIEENEIKNLIEKISSLWNEVEVSRSRIQELELITKEIMNESNIKIEAILAEKKCEIEKCEKLQERKISLETEIQKFKKKICEMETRTNEDEKKILQLEIQAKNFESQLKQKEASFEKSLNEMQNSLKNSESLLAKTENQRDVFESRLNKMKKIYGDKEREAENKILELSKEIKAVNAELSKVRGSETEQLLELAFKLEREEAHNEELIKMITNHFHIADHYIPKGHAEIIDLFTKKFQEIQQIEEKNEQLQKQLTELQSRTQTQPKESIRKSIWSSQINELKRRNEELEIQLNQKQLEIENQERAMSEQSTILKLRDEVIALLRGKPPSSRGNNDEAHLSIPKKKNQRDREQVDKQIAEKAENLQELYSTLEKKQMQISRLEHLVKQMEIQEERSQEQRTRLEKRIAQLELSMHYRGKSNRYVDQENPISPSKISTLSNRESVKEKNIFHNRSLSKPSVLRSPIRDKKFQRSKTLNSFKIKSNTENNDYTSRVVDEISQTLKRDNFYDYKKRNTNDERGAKYIDKNIIDPCDISRDEIHESLYNYLVEPWMFEGQSSNLIPPSIDDLRRRNWGVYSPNSDFAINIKNSIDLSPRRQRATNDCSRESRCGSPQCRRQSLQEWNSSSPRIMRARMNSQNTTTSRLQKS